MRVLASQGVQEDLREMSSAASDVPARPPRDRPIGGIGVLCQLDGELDAIRVWLEDTEAAVCGTVVGV